MPTNLTDASSFDVVIAPVGTDIRNAASVRNALQTVANRTKFLYDRHDVLADIATLKAIASPADKLVRFVKGYGVYSFDTGSAAAESLPWVVQPTVGTGRWIHQSKLAIGDLIGAANGIATLDGSGKVTGTQLTNRLISVQSAKLTANVTSTTNSMVDVAGLSVTFSATAGDILVLDANLFAQLQAGTTLSFAQFVVVDGGTPQYPGTLSTISRSPGQADMLGMSNVHTVVNTGSVTVKVQMQAGSTTTVQIVGNPSGNGAAQSSIRVLQFRP
jgi:hypothetical protein